MAKRKSEEVPPAGVVVGAAVGPCLDDETEPVELRYADVTPERAAPVIASGVTSLAKWHATRCPGRISRNSGTSVSHSFGCSSRSRSQQRVWKRQPDGGLAGDGTSPFRTIRRLRTVGSGSGTADMRLTVYGCCGLSYTSSTSPISASTPRYITPRRSPM